LSEEKLRLSSAFHAIVVTTRLECAEKATSGVAQLLRDGHASGKLSELYAALEASKALREAGLMADDDDATLRSSAVEALAALSNGDGAYRASSGAKARASHFNAALVLEAAAAAATPTQLDAILQRLPALLARATADEQGVTFVDAPTEHRRSLTNLRATAGVAAAIGRLLDNDVKLAPLDDAQLAGIARYLCSFKRVDSLAAAASLARGLRALADLKTRRPSSVTLATTPLSADGSALQLHVADVLGRHVDVRSVHVALLDAAQQSALVRTEAKASGGGAASTLYRVALPAGTLSCQRYTAVVSVRGTTAAVLDNHARLSFTHHCDVQLLDGTLALLAAASSRASASEVLAEHQFSASSSLESPIALASKQSLRITFSLQDAVKKQPMNVQQVLCVRACE
jgi:molybdopterin-guanine dinucleotide biosynthesis protein A